MKPKEKAKQLVENYLKKIIELAYAETKTKELARESALICVDEIELYRKQIEGEYDEDLYHAYGVEEYWQEVKQEISLL